MNKKFGLLLSTGLLACGLVFSPIPYNVEAATSNGVKVVQLAEKLKGTEFKWGGTTPKVGFDASGFTQHLYLQMGVQLPRITKDQYKRGTAVKLKDLQEGDLVFYNTNQKGPSFVGIYVGNQKFISATSKGVMVSNMNSNYWKPKFVGAKRVLEAAPKKTVAIDTNYEIPGNVNPAFIFFKYVMTDSSVASAQFKPGTGIDVELFKKGLKTLEFKEMKEVGRKDGKVEYQVTFNVERETGYAGSLSEGSNTLFFLIEKKGEMEFQIVSYGTGKHIY